MPQPMQARRRSLVGAFCVLPLVLARGVHAQDKPRDDSGDGGPYVPTPMVIVERMLELARVRRDDVVADLGSGDGRLVIEAARRYGARGFGIEREERLVGFARDAAAQARVAGLASFRQGDLFDADLRSATVVTLYLLPRLLVRLAPKLQAELAPGARVVSHDYPIEAWKPERTLEFDVPEKEAQMLPPQTKLYLYTIRRS